MSLLHFFLSPYGRISRQAFWLGLVVLMALTVPVALLLEPQALQPVGNAPKPPSLPYTLWSLLITWPSAAISMKRFNDRDWPAWIGWVLAAAMVILVLGNHIGFLLDPNAMSGAEKLLFSAILLFFIWAIVDNGFLKGTQGPNRHGPDPLVHNAPT